MMLPANITSSQENSVLSIAASGNKGLLIRFLNEQVEDGFYTLVIDYLKDSNFDLSGMMVDEAEVVLGKFIDDSIMAGLSQVLIIHGKGTGALRKGVHEYLKHHRNVAGFNFADMSEGGTGATLVTLK